MVQPSRVVAINRKDGTLLGLLLPSYSHLPGYVLRGFSGNVICPSDFEEERLCMQKLLLEPSLSSLPCSCPRPLGSLATELFLFVPQHQDQTSPCLRDIKTACQQATHGMTSNKQKPLLMLKTSCSELILREKNNITKHIPRCLGLGRPHAAGPSHGKKGKYPAPAARHF